VNEILSQYCACVGIPAEAAPAVRIGEAITLPSRLPTTDLATGSVAAAALSGALLAAARNSAAQRDPVAIASTVRVDPLRVAASFRGDRLIRLDGQSFPSFAPPSGFFRTRDGWLRTHANYPHHRARLLAALGLDAPDPDTDPDPLRAAVTGRLAELSSLHAEDLIAQHHGVAVAVRTPQAWAAHPQAAAVAALPLIGIACIADGPQRTRIPAPADPLRPAAGLRVLDFTQVIAGPVATRTLALLGAHVLRVDSPDLPEIRAQHLDNGMGKRSALLNLRQTADRATLERLLDEADIVVTGYRPGALDAFGLDPHSLAARRPGLVIATLSAWGSAGPWAGRRGFDSLVQAATGISLRESPDAATSADPAATRPGALPAQALDHASGYLLAGAILTAVRRQLTDGGTWRVQAHLARTAHALLALAEQTSSPGPHAVTDLDAALAGCLTEQPTPSGLLRYPLPAVTFKDGPADYPSPGGIWGADPPRWPDDDSATAASTAPACHRPD
jgi:crotonobetainyl-CoA:carnitine CoA-transferase CaiB-like acyl-CoA transferase